MKMVTFSRACGSFFFATVLLAGCSSTDETAGSHTAGRGYDMGNGIASFYDDHGNLTAYGESFDAGALTAAMVDVSMRDARICVTNLNNKRKVEVRINDRGPWGTGAIIDLSTRAMSDLGGIEAGRIRVNLYVLGQGETCGYRAPSPEEIAKLCARKFSQSIEGSGSEAVLNISADIACPATKAVVTFSGTSLPSTTLQGVVKESNANKTIYARVRLADLQKTGYTTATVSLGKNATTFYTHKQSLSLPELREAAPGATGTPGLPPIPPPVEPPPPLPQGTMTYPPLTAPPPASPSNT